MPVDEIEDSFEELRLYHMDVIDRLVPDVTSGSEDGDGGDDRDYYDADHPMSGTGASNDWLTTASHAGSAASHASSLPLGASALSTPPSSVVASTRAALGSGQSQRPPPRNLANSLGLRPQFNLDSGASLLANFRDGMSHLSRSLGMRG